MIQPLYHYKNFKATSAPCDKIDAACFDLLFIGLAVTLGSATGLATGLSTTRLATGLVTTRLATTLGAATGSSFSYSTV